jgi:hypothetical protein
LENRTKKVKSILEEWIEMIEKDVKKAIKEVKYFIENPKNVKK